MATDIERLVVQLSADVKKYENALNKAMGTTNRQARSIENRFKKMNSNIATGFTGLGRSIAGAFAVAGGIRGFQSLLDSATRIDNALKVAGLSGDELEKVYGRLRDSAVKSAAPMESLVELYGRAALVQKELGISGEELLNFTDKIAVALRVSGKSAAESSGALLQLSQALGSGVVRAEEFNSILEGALPIAQAAAAGLKEAGGSVSKLRQLVVDGKISSEAFFRAFEAGSVILEEKVSGAALTTSQALENIKTAAINATRDFAKGSLAADDLGSAFQMMADKINSVNFEEFGQEVRKVIEWLNGLRDAMNWVQNMGSNFGSATGLDNIGKFLTGGAVQRQLGPVTITSSKALQERIDGAFAGAVQTATNLTEDAIRRSAGAVATTPKTGRLPTSVVTPVSTGDFAPPASTKKGGTGGRGRRDRPDDFQREIEQIKERTAAIQAETAAMAGINPLIDDYGFAIEKARAKQDLLTAAQKAGIAVTPQLEAQIDSLAEGYANASVAAEQLAESQDKARQTAEEMRDLGKDVMGGFIHDLLDGKSAADALAGALGKIGDKLLDMAMNDMFGGGGSGGGFLSALFGGGQSSFIPGILSGARVGLFHKGGVVGSGGGSTTVNPGVFAGAPRYHSGGIAGLKPDEVPAILQKGEVVLPRGAQSPSSGTTFAPVYHIDARGADAAAVARLESGLAKTNREMQARIESGVRSAQQRNVKLGR